MILIKILCFMSLIGNTIIGYSFAKAPIDKTKSEKEIKAIKTVNKIILVETAIQNAVDILFLFLIY